MSKFSFPRRLLTPGQGHPTRFEIIALVLAFCFVFDLASHLMSLQEEARLWELASLLFLLGIYGLLLYIPARGRIARGRGRDAPHCLHLGWTYWEFAEGFGFLNAWGSDIEPELSKGLLGKPGS